MGSKVLWFHFKNSCSGFCFFILLVRRDTKNKNLGLDYNHTNGNIWQTWSNGTTKNPNISSGNDVITLWNQACSAIYMRTNFKMKFPDFKDVLRHKKITLKKHPFSKESQEWNGMSRGSRNSKFPGGVLIPNRSQVKRSISVEY